MWDWLRKGDSHRLGGTILIGLLVGLLFSVNGCTRRFFQRRADSEVSSVLRQKDHYEQWKLDEFYVWPHPLSRFADPTDWNRPPMPPDDPAAWDLSPHPQRPLLRGYAYSQGTGYLELMRRYDEETRTRIDKEKVTPPEDADVGEEPLLPGETKTFDQRAAEVNAQIERELNSPTTTTEALPEDFGADNTSKNKPFLLDMNQISNLGFMNSPQFQTNRENLYLSALAVTAERFSFIAQPYLTDVLIRERSGSQSADGQTNRWTNATNTGFTKLFSSGALLLFNFANQTVYNLGAGLGLTSVSTVNLDFVQPFLAGGGRAVVLEPLTQTERNLVYAIRDYFRFRQEYYVFFAAGQATFIPGVQAGVTALTPATQPTPGPFVPGPFALPLLANPATVQVAPQPFLGPNFGAGVAVTPQGYLGTIAERAVLANQYKNIQALQRFLRLFDAYLEGGLINQVQRGQVEQSLLNSIVMTLGLHQSYRISLDQLKQQLGLPMTIFIELDPAPLQPMINLVEAYEKLSIDNERVSYNAIALGRSTEARQLRARLHRLVDRTPLMRDTDARKRILERWAYWEKFGQDMQTTNRINTLRERLTKILRQLNDLREKRGKSPGQALSPEDTQLFQDLVFERDVLALELTLSEYETQPWLKLPADAPVARAAEAERLFRAVYQNLLALSGLAVIERQAKIKKLWPALPAICAGGVDCLSASDDDALLACEQTVMTARVDIMNVRGQLVDAWRKIRVSANALMGTFNVDYHIDASSPFGQAKPFAIGGSTTRNQLIFNMSPPIVRVLQRNNYRSTLIFFQQARRNLMSYEDQQLFNIRLDLRGLRVGANNYHRVQKRAIELAYLNIDQSLQAFSQPQAPAGGDIAGLVGPVGARPAVGDPAALTNQLLTSQTSLLNAQNNLYNLWIGFLTARMAFYRDLGIMRFDNRGVWIDDNSACPCNTSQSNNDNNQPAGSQQQPGYGSPEQPQPSPERLPQPRPDAEPTAQGPALEPSL